MRINKYLASLGVASRRKVDALIEAGKVKINGRAARLGEQIDPARDKVAVLGRDVSSNLKKRVYFVVNKPKGVISTVSDTHGRRTVVSLVKSKERLFPVGRLDMESEGLMILTNDGELMQRMTHPKYHVPKVYEVLNSGSVNDEKIARIKSGMRLKNGEITAPCEVKVLNVSGNRTLLRITLGEGKNRQIRRMYESLHLYLVNLKRVSMGPVKLGNLEKGKSRKLTEDEVRGLYFAAGLSSVS